MSPAWLSRSALALGLLALPAAVAVASARVELILLWAVLALSATGLWRLAAWRARPRASISLADAEPPAQVSRAARAGGYLGCLSLLWGSMAFVSLPALLSARASYNMDLTRRGIRRVVEAEARQARGNGGLFVPLERLGLAEAALPERSGYRWSFHPVPASAEELSRTGVAAGSLRAYAYSAVPVRAPGDWAPTGLYGFCGDSEGRFCRTRSGKAPLVDEGRCPPPKADSASDAYECESGGHY